MSFREELAARFDEDIKKQYADIKIVIDAVDYQSHGEKDAQTWMMSQHGVDKIEELFKFLEMDPDRRDLFEGQCVVQRKLDPLRTAAGESFKLLLGSKSDGDGMKRRNYMKGFSNEVLVEWGMLRERNIKNIVYEA